MALDLAAIYRDLHAHPELSFAEHATAARVVEHLTALGGDGVGIEIITGLGGTGVAGVLTNGDGPVIALRADMDGLPVREETGLAYASTATGVDPEGRTVPVMHACGHDMHITCLLGALERLLATREQWRGTVVAIFQPAEEWGGGAAAMVRDGLYEKAPRPEVVLGQHVVPLPAGTIGLHPGAAMAAADTLTVTLTGRGGHGSRPEATVDPVYLAAATALRLHGIVAREVGAAERAVLTVGQIHGGTKHNIIPPEAWLGLTVRSFDDAVRARLLAAIDRVVQGEAAASGATARVAHDEELPLTYNDPTATARVTAALRAALGEDAVVDPGAMSGSEDVGVLATALDVPLVYWFLGGGDPALWEGRDPADMPDDLPSNHSPHYAPVIEPTLGAGVTALVAAAREWLA